MIFTGKNNLAKRCEIWTFSKKGLFQESTFRSNKQEKTRQTQVIPLERLTRSIQYRIYGFPVIDSTVPIMTKMIYKTLLKIV